MKKLFLIINILFFFHNSNGQQWSYLPNTSIQKLKITGIGFNNVTYFKKDSGFIVVDNSFANDFTKLLMENHNCFDSVCKNLSGMFAEMFDDSIKNYFSKSNISLIAYLSKRTIHKLNDGKIVWKIMNHYGEGLPCESQIIIEKINKKGRFLFKFISVEEGDCEI